MLRPFGKRFIYVLIAALLLTQQGFAVHALSHGVDALKTATGGATERPAPPTDRHCELCLTYAQVAAGAAPAIAALIAAALEHAAPYCAPHQPGALFARAYQSRAPPRTL